MSAPRRGASLVAVLAAIVIVGLLVAAVGRDVVRASRAARLLARATDAPGVAEAALLRAWTLWAQAEHSALAQGEWREWSATEGGEAVRLRAVRLGAELFQLDARVSLALAPGSATGRNAARRAQALLLGVRPARLPVRGAVVSGGDVLGSGLVATGRDTVPPGWWCTASDTGTVPAIVAPPAAVVQLAPPSPDTVTRDPAAASASSYAIVPPDTLAPRLQTPLAHAGPISGATIEPRTDGAGRCLTGPTAPYNWGDPARPSACASYVPFVHVQGDLVAPHGRSQGLLLVDGDLVLDGGFEHWGVVLVQGEIRASGAGSRVLGAILARGGLVATAPGALAVRHSSCVARAALQAGGVVAPVPGASWREWW